VTIAADGCTTNGVERRSTAAPRLLHPESGRQQALAANQQYKDAQFNPFQMRPTWNRDRTRLLVFDRVCVLDRKWNTVFETHAEATLLSAGTARCHRLGGCSR